MQKQINKITAVVLLFFIFGGFAFTVVIRKDRGKVRTDDMQLYSGDAVYMEESPGSTLNTRFTNGFAGRRSWIAIKSRIETELSESIVNGVYVDKSRLLDAEISDRPSAVENAASINSFAESCDGTVCFIAVPTSSGVYGDVLPEYLRSYPESQQISEFYDSLSSDIRKIDAYNILKMLNDNYIYYRNDTKWTSYGAYCVYRTAIQKLGFLPTPYDKYTIEHVTDSFRGDLYRKTLYSKAKADILDIYDYPSGAEVISCSGVDSYGNMTERKLFDKQQLSSDDMYSLYLGKKSPMYRIKTTVNNDRSLLVVTDDYGRCFIQFLIQHYSTIDVFVPEDADRGLERYADPADYEQTLFLFGIENMNNDDIFSKIKLKGA